MRNFDSRLTLLLNTNLHVVVQLLVVEVRQFLRGSLWTTHHRSQITILTLLVLLK